MSFSMITRFFGLYRSGSTDGAPTNDAGVVSSSHNSDGAPTASISSAAHHESPSSSTMGHQLTVGDEASGEEMEVDAASSSPVNMALVSTGQETPVHEMLGDAFPAAPVPEPADEINEENDTEDNDQDEDGHNENDNQEEMVDPPSWRFREHRSSLQSSVPTFSRKHNKMWFTDDFEICDKRVKAVLAGYIVEPEGDNNENVAEQSDEEEHAEENCDKESAKEEVDEKEGGKGNENEIKPKTNEQAVAEAIAAGVKAHDFAAMPIREEIGMPFYSAVILEDYPTAVVFPAHQKALQFQYMRYLLKHDVFDLPHYQFTVDDVDRLYTAGFIRSRHLDTYLLRAMMATGVIKRSMGLNPHDPNRILPPRACWTIPKNDRRPSRDEIRDYIIAQENERYTSWDPKNSYPLKASERPELTGDYVLHRMDVHGMFGLDTLDIDLNDLDVRELFRGEKDPDFLPPRDFRYGWWMYHTGDEYLDENMDINLSGTGLSVSGIAMSATPAFTHPDSPALTRSNPPGPSRPESPERGRGDVSNGKKRARSPSSDEASDGSSRHTRARLSEESDSFTASPGASTSAAGAAAQSSGTEGVSSPSRGKKRVRDDEQEDEDVEASTPMKKLKTASGSIAVFSNAISALASFPTFAAGLFQTTNDSSDDEEDVAYGPIPGAFPDPITQPEAYESEEDTDMELEDSPMDDANDVWRPHPPAPHHLIRQNAFIIKADLTIPAPSDKYVYPACLM